MAVKRFEDSLQRQYDGLLRSHVQALQNEFRDHVGQEEDKPRKELQQALTQESSMCRDQLHQTLRHQVCQEEHADAISTPEISQLRQMVTEQKDALICLEAHSQHMVSQQQEACAHKQQALFQQFDGALKDKDSAVQVLTQELANDKERSLLELEQAHQDVEHRAQVARPVFADVLSTQPYATPVEKKTFQAAVAHAVPVQTHSPACSNGASAGNVNLKARSKGSFFLYADAYEPRHRLQVPPRLPLRQVSGGPPGDGDD